MQFLIYFWLLMGIFNSPGDLVKASSIQENVKIAEKHPLIDNTFLQDRKEGREIKATDYTVDNLYFWGLILLGFLLLALFYVSPGYYQTLFAAFFSGKSFLQLSEMSRQRFFLQNIVLDLLFIFAATLLVFILQETLERLTPIKIYYLFLIALLLAAILIIISILSLWIFYGKGVVESYTFRVISLNRVFGVVLLPVLIVLEMSALKIEQVAVMGGIFFVSFLLYRFIIMALWLTKKSSFSFFYNFIYLCTFEILILFLIIKQYTLFFGQ